MTDYEIYDKFFADEEYDLEKCTVAAYSYWSGWNSGLKRASILIRNEIRPKGHWIRRPQGHYVCSLCEKGMYKSDFCPSCGADMRGDAE